MNEERERESQKRLIIIFIIQHPKAETAEYVKKRIN